MTKAEAMKLRMSQENGGSAPQQRPPLAATNQQQIQMESNIQRQSKPPMAAPNQKPLPPKAPAPKATSVRASQQMSQGESIYNFKEPQPNVVVYSANQTRAPEPVREAPKQRKPGVPLLSGGRARASSV